MKEKIYIKNLDDLEKFKKTHDNGFITVNSNIEFDIDHVDLIKGDWLFHLRVNGNLKAESITVWDVKAHNIDLIGCIKARNIDTRNISAYAISVKEKIKTYKMNAEVSIKAGSIKIGNYKTKHKTIDEYTNKWN